jgi:hypothetical protein
VTVEATVASSTARRTGKEDFIRIDWPALARTEDLRWTAAGPTRAPARPEIIMDAISNELRG